MTIILWLIFSMGGGDYARLSPFQELRWQGQRVEVRLDDKWYRAQTMAGVAVNRILAFCRKTYGRKWQKRFGEDLIQVFHEMGHPLKEKHIDLSLVELETGKRVHLERVLMTAENREAILRKNRRSSMGPRIDPAKTLTAEQVKTDKLLLLKNLQDHHSYFYKDTEISEEIGRRLAQSEGSLTIAELARKLIQVTARLGDGHTRLISRSHFLPLGYLPKDLVPTPEGLVVLDREKGQLMNPKFPFLTAIDNTPLKTWQASTRHYVIRGSNAMLAEQVASLTAHIALARLELDRPERNTVALTLSDEVGNQIETQLEIVPHRGRRDRLAFDKPKVLAENIGYLPIKAMDGSDAYKRELMAAMASFRNTAGLIIDVRGNGGGSRRPLLTLAQYFLDKDQIVVANVAYYRGSKPYNPEGHLADRFLYPLTASVWSPRQRACLQEFQRQFKPTWNLPEGLFSPIHMMVLQGRENEDTYRYEADVVILMDGGCYSATDIFLGAMKQIPGVTTLGTTSGGGSGRSKHVVTLPHSGLTFRISTMASFQPNGKFYDGHGVLPDVVVKRPWTDYRDGVDTQMETALKLFNQVGQAN